MRKWLDTFKPLLRVASRYWQVSSKHEKITDIGIPFLLTTIIVVLVSIKQPAVQGFLVLSNQIVNTVITVLSILAGFNVAAVSVIASSQSPTIKRMAKHKNDNEPSPLEGILSFFSWAIAVQLIVLLGSIMYSIVAGTILTPGKAIFAQWEFPKLPILIAIMFIGISAAFHSLFLSIRNIAGLFLTVAQAAKEEAEKDEKESSTQ